MTKVEDKKVIPLKSGAILTIDEFYNIWYHSDIEMVIGKIHRGRFVPTHGMDFSPELLIAISEIFTKNWLE